MNNHIKRVTVVGLGYIGLPTCVIAAESGYDVSGFDIDQEKINTINSGKSPLQEPDLDFRLAQVVGQGKLRAFNELPAADCFVLAVPTPFKEGKKADLTALFNAGTRVARIMQSGALIIIESTIPVGTTRRFTQLLQDISGLESEKDFFVAHCPERVLPSKIFSELVKNDRVIGGVGELAGHLAKEFYQHFVTGTIFVTDDKTAEMVKLVENSSRDVQIALANQLHAMCKRAQIDVYQVIELANKHPRVNLLQPGCGVGGHCIAVDPWFLIESFPHETSLLKTARTINDAKPHQVVEQVLEMVRRFRQGSNKNKKPNILLLGLTFKPNSDDIRESPALQIAKDLATKSSVLDLSVCEPNLKKEEILSRGFSHVVDVWQGVQTADIVVVLVKHALFEELSPADLQGKLLIDTCGLIYSISEKKDLNTLPVMPLKRAGSMEL